jgi:hypothetical protein
MKNSGDYFMSYLEEMDTCDCRSIEEIAKFCKDNNVKDHELIYHIVYHLLPVNKNSFYEEIKDALIETEATNKANVQFEENIKSLKNFLNVSGYDLQIVRREESPQDA